eukprot:8889536-Alexandrium_andersonii.AAC.1
MCSRRFPWSEQEVAVDVDAAQPGRRCSCHRPRTTRPRDPNPRDPPDRPAPNPPGQQQSNSTDGLQ